MNVVMIGSGYVGLVSGACFAEFGAHVTCIDVDRKKIDQLNAGGIPIYEPGLEDLVDRNVTAGRLAFTTEYDPAIGEADLVFIAVGTPQGNDGRADLSFVRDVAKAVGENLNSFKVVTTKSTVPAGTGKMVREIIQESCQGDQKFSVASNPEFLREGSAIEDFMRPNRVVLGVEDEMAAAILKDLYRPLFLLETPFVITNVESSELIKYASNSFLATKITFINEVAELCERLGADVHHVAKGMGLDRRIGPKFLHPGPGYGGSCFPKDTQALADPRQHLVGQPVVLGLDLQHDLDQRAGLALVLVDDPVDQIVARGGRVHVAALLRRGRSSAGRGRTGPGRDGRSRSCAAPLLGRPLRLS